MIAILVLLVVGGVVCWIVAKNSKPARPPATPAPVETVAGIPVETDKVAPLYSTAVALGYVIGNARGLIGTRIALAELMAYELRLIGDELVCSMLDLPQRPASTPDFSKARVRWRVPLANVQTVEVQSAGQFFGWSGGDSALALINEDIPNFYRKIERPVPAKNPHHVLVEQTAQQVVFLFMADGERLMMYQNTGNRGDAIKAKVALENWIAKARKVATAAAPKLPAAAASSTDSEPGFSL